MTIQWFALYYFGLYRMCLGGLHYFRVWQGQETPLEARTLFIQIYEFLKNSYTSSLNYFKMAGVLTTEISKNIEIFSPCSACWVLQQDVKCNVTQFGVCFNSISNRVLQKSLFLIKHARWVQRFKARHVCGLKVLLCDFDRFSSCIRNQKWTFLGNPFRYQVNTNTKLYKTKTFSDLKYLTCTKRDTIFRYFSI